MSLRTNPSGTVSSNPKTPREVLYWVEHGRISSDAALRHLSQLDRRSASAAATEGKANHTSQKDRADEVLRQLDQLVGLSGVKLLVREIRAFIEVQQRRLDFHLPQDTQMLHMVFQGAPGTGKTTVARLLGQLFEALGVLPKGHLVEVERADLVGEYIGHTAQKTREVIKRSLGGIMFVDEAYSLARGGEKDFGKEAIDTLVKAMEDYRGEFLLILAGYPHEMAWFMSTNPGLLSRFPIHLEFPDYNAQELLEIGRAMLAAGQYVLTKEAEQGFLKHLEDRQGNWHTNAGNARMIRNILEHAVRRQAVRLAGHLDAVTRHDLTQLTWADLEGGL
ncbi:MAG: AAA family ATPase [Firmicutes bacterium]|nr:AAA family ATPase [Bacillota bacterium]